jgi:hypothetical protein
MITAARIDLPFLFMLTPPSSIQKYSTSERESHAELRLAR